MLAGYDHRVALRGGPRRCRRGHQQGQHRLLHTGFDAKPGTLESRMVCGGYHLLSDYAAATGIPVERTGAMLVAWNDEQLDALPALADQGGSQRLSPTAKSSTPTSVYRAAPQPRRGALGGLTVPDESIICTWTTNLALATDAVDRGVALHTGHPHGQGEPAA